MKSQVLISFSLSIGLVSMAQNPDLKRTNHWYFGHHASLDFSSGSPVPGDESAMSVLERCAVISDTTGQLLFYTDAHRVWNRNHQIMQGGDSIGPFVSSPRDGAVIVPKPGDNDIYYIFNVDGWENQFERGIRWHEVDMSLDNGFGAVTSVNNLLHAPVSEQLAATRHANGCDFWVCTHERSSDKFICFQVTEDGVLEEPVVSAVGQDFSEAQEVYYLAGGFNLVFSPSGQIASQIVSWGHFLATGIQNQMQLFQFDKLSGNFSSAINLIVDTTASGGYFSPDSFKFYFQSGFWPPGDLYQFDLSNFEEVFINQSRTSVWQSSVAIAGDGQNAPDGRLYLSGEWDYVTSTPNPYFLSVIEFPNESGPVCNVVHGTQTLGTGRATQGLPNFVSDFTVNVAPPLCGDINTESLKSEGAIWSVFPNPASRHLTLSNKDSAIHDIEISLFDFTGRLCLNQLVPSGRNDFRINLPALPSGLYLLEIRAKSGFDKIETFKIIIHQ
jgi:hypothetical protein